MKLQLSARRLEKFIAYVLGRRPDEFGLVPDAEGWIKMKDLLKAINEEDGWRHVRLAHIDEIVLTQPDAAIEISDARVRALSRENLPVPQPANRPPKLLYACIRRRAHPVVLEKGLNATEGEKIVLATAADLALRIGRRRDPQPVLLTVNVEQTLARGTALQQVGELIYTADAIPVGCFTAPPLSKEKPATAKPAIEDERA
ncbi:MAG: RNA 2'-phosphotransferase, partial [Desulfobacterales bacterium]